MRYGSCNGCLKNRISFSAHKRLRDGFRLEAPRVPDLHREDNGRHARVIVEYRFHRGIRVNASIPIGFTAKQRPSVLSTCLVQRHPAFFPRGPDRLSFGCDHVQLLHNAALIFDATFKVLALPLDVGNRFA